MSDVVGPGPSLDSALLLTAWEVCKMLRGGGGRDSPSLFMQRKLG